MLVAIPKEITAAENRVALVPQLVAPLLKLGCTVLLEKNAGLGANYPDSSYADVQVCQDAGSLYQNADIILKVEPPFKEEIALFKKNAIVIGFCHPLLYPERVVALRDNAITSFALENLPRISRAQGMDALSSQATIAGYKAALLGANMFSRFFPMLTTAAGTLRPANVLVIGAGVAGLQAIATAKRLGAIVKAYDIRTAAREQIESLGAKMIQIDVKAESAGGYARELTLDEKEKQQLALFEAISKSDVIISTAFVPGKPAPKIITQKMIASMAPGSIIVDLAASMGGNCELTQAGKTITVGHVTLSGPLNLPSLMAQDASNMYAKNLINFLSLFIKDKQLNIDWNDPIISDTLLTHEGKVTHLPTREFIERNS